MSVRLCSKAGKHSGRQVEALCLQESCRKDRLLCFYCVFESHQGHHIAYLHRELKGPLCNLYQQAQNVSSDKLSRERLETTFANITQACEKLGKIAKNRLGQVREQLSPQMEAIRRSFRRNSVDEIIKDLTSTQNLSVEKVEKYASILRFYDDNTAPDLEKLDRNSTILWQALNTLIEEATNKIEAVFSQLDILVAGVDLTKDFPFAHQKCQQVLQEKIAENMAQLKGEKMAGDAVIQEQQVSQQKIEGEAAEEAEEMVQEGQIIEKEQAEVKPIPPPVAVSAAQVAPEPSPQSSLGVIEQEKQGVIDQIKGKDGSRLVIKTAQPLYPLQQHQPEDNEWQPVKIQQVQKTIRTLRKGVQHRVDAVFITASYPHELNRLLRKVQPQGVRTLVIRCDTRLDILDPQSITLICQMKRLTSLRVYMARNLQEWMAIELLKNLSNLIELVLAEFMHFTMRVVDVIKAYNINLSRICFTSDLRALRSAEEALEFLPDIPQSVHGEEQWQSLTQSALLLTTLQLQNATNHPYWINYLRNYGETLREVTISQSEHQHIDYTQLMKALAKCNGLECLRLEMLQFQEEALLEVIKNNHNLQVFVVSECPCVGVRSYRALFKHAANLRALSINLDDKFNAKYANNAKQLEVLILRGCYGVIQANFCALIASLKHLKCLSVNYCDTWLGRNAFWEISKLKSLQVLNISNNQNCLHPFNLNCLKLRTFICSNNGLSYSAFSDHSFTAPIHKLSISGVAKDGSKEVLDLELLRFFFPKLTHLKAVNYDRLSIDPLFFDNHKHLVSIVVGGFSKREDVDAIRMYCARRRINFTCIDEQ